VTSPVGTVERKVRLGLLAIISAWLSTHIWEHYVLQDKEYLKKKKGYPIMKRLGILLGWMWFLIKAKLITSPSTSARKQIHRADGFIEQPYVAVLNFLIEFAGLSVGLIKAKNFIWSGFRGRGLGMEKQGFQYRWKKKSARNGILIGMTKIKTNHQSLVPDFFLAITLHIKTPI